MDSESFYAVATAFVLVTFLAFINERFVELLVKRFLARFFDEQTLKDITAYVAFVTGIVVAIVFGVDAFIDLARAFDLSPLPGSTVIMTALLVGGGSNLIHDVWGAVQALKGNVDANNH